MNKNNRFPFDTPRVASTRFTTAYFIELSYQWSQYDAYMRWRQGLPPTVDPIERKVSNEKRVKQEKNVLNLWLTLHRTRSDRCKPIVSDSTRRMIMNDLAPIKVKDSKDSNLATKDSQKEEGEI